MSDISRIDENFAVKGGFNIPNVELYTADNKAISLHGVFYENGFYRRLPQGVAESVSEGVNALHTHTAGGRIKFVTDSSLVAVKVVMPQVCKLPHIALTGSAGLDMYVGNEYCHTFIPPYDMTAGYEDVFYFNTKAQREITINLPLYSSVSEIYLGLESGASLSAPEPYRYPDPIVFYGSSITQGGCASRPGTSYQSIVSRDLDADYVNLGFSGSAKGEDEIAEYISELNMSVFVYDYDYNAPTTEHLEATHLPMLLKIREKNPELPIIMMARPQFTPDNESAQRLEIIKKTYRYCIEQGDKNVHLIDGTTLMALAKGEGTVDGCHPNDLGFYSMAQAIIDTLKLILN